jgi:hypothetical protein
MPFQFHRKSNRGLQEIFGMLLTICMLFTAIIPLFLFVNQVNNHYDNTVQGITAANQIKSLEDLDVFAYPVGNNFTSLNIILKNIGVIPVKIVRLWVTDLDTHATQLWNETEITEFQTELFPSTYQILYNVSIADFGVGDRLLFVKLTSERGNIFPSKSNPLWITGEGWKGSTSDPFSMQFVFTNPKATGAWKIEGEIKVWYNKTIDPDNLNLTYYNTMEIDQLVQGEECVQTIEVPYEGIYQVIVDITTPRGNGEVYNDTVELRLFKPLIWNYIILRVRV